VSEPSQPAVAGGRLELKAMSVGEIAALMLDGTLCVDCGWTNLGPPAGEPWRCPSCADEVTAARPQQTQASRQRAQKAPCPTCGKRVKLAGMADHQRDVHCSGNAAMEAR